jgi:hypothetical protein
MLDIEKFPDYFESYNWNKKHSLFGYPSDCFPNFDWIASLERRFEWLKLNCDSENTASIYLLKEMIQWGGSQNGTLQKFEDGAEQHNIQALMHNTIANLDNPKKAIAAALQFPGMGLTYASKLLRFLDPERYGALDSRIRESMKKRLPGILSKIQDSSNASMVAGYDAFTSYVNEIKDQLNHKKIIRPECVLLAGVGPAHWRSADVEMSLFGWASSDEP